MVEAEEEWTRVPFFARFIDNTMNCRHKVVVSLPHETVGNVDHDAPWDRIGLNPVARFAKDFEASVTVLGDESEALKVCVCANTELI